MPQRDPLRLEGVSTIERRRRLIDEAIRDGRHLRFVSALMRRDVMVERALRGVTLDAQIRFAREIEAPIIRAVAGILGSQPDRPTGFAAPIPGQSALPPLPSRVPSSLSTALHNITAQDVVFRLIRDEMAELADQEVAFTARAMARSYGPAALLGPLGKIEARSGAGVDPMTGPLLTGAAEPVAAQIVERTQRAPMFGAVVERTWGEAIGGLQATVEKQIGQALQRGATNDEIVAMLRGSRKRNYTDGTLGKWRSHNIRSFVRTVGTHVAAQSREGSFAAMGVPFVRLVATLDLRTTIECINLDGTVWPIGEGPRPPIHPGCRTAIAPAWSKDPVEDMVPRASMHGRVPGSTIATEWWYGLTHAEQVEIVGPTLAAALRSGSLKFSQIVGPDGVGRLPIRELRARGLLAS